jgi:hypothetical protein
MTDADAPGVRGTGRRLKDQKRIPLNLRITPRMREGLERLAYSNGRSLSAQTEILLEFALFKELAAHGEHYQPLLPPPSTKDLGDRLFRLETEFAGLRAAIEKGLDRNTDVIGRVEARLYRRVAEFEAKVATDTTEMTTAISHLDTVTAHLFAALTKVDAALTGRRREPANEPPRPRLVRGTDEALG